MKFKTTIILFVIFFVLMAYIFLFESKSKNDEHAKEKLVALSSESIQKIIYKNEDETLEFQKNAEGEWLIIKPLEANADKYEVNRLAEEFADLRIERVVDEEPADLEKYGIPKKEMSLYFKDKEQQIKIFIGMENPLDNTFFAKRENETRVVLLSSSLKNLLEKSAFDYRQKDIFKFKTDEAKSIKLRAKKIQWETLKKEEEWFLKKPVKALVKSSKINDILYSLSNLKAKEFVSEEKTKEDIKNYGLDQADYEVSLSIPLSNQEVTFFIHKDDEKVYATTSLSPKIIEIEDSIISDLEKKAEELREKEVANFYSWEVNRLHIKKGNIALTLAKDEENKWHFESQDKEEADNNKIETFIRKIENLEATEFIDPPLNLKDYGLESPQARVQIWVEEKEEKVKEITILIGSEDKEAKHMLVKNTRFEYLFKVDSAFLKEFPKNLKDWKMEEENESVT